MLNSFARKAVGGALRAACSSSMHRHPRGRNLSSLESFDPPYLDKLKPPLPVYDILNVQIKGYDYALVENYQKTVHKIAKVMDLDVVDSWATPCVQTKIQKYKPNSTVVSEEYLLNTYERNVQISELPGTQAPVFFELIQAALPQGVSLRVHEHSAEHDDVRHIPDLELKSLKTQLEGIAASKKKK